MDTEIVRVIEDDDSMTLVIADQDGNLFLRQLFLRKDFEKFNRIREKFGDSFHQFYPRILREGICTFKMLDLHYVDRNIEYECTYAEAIEALERLHANGFHHGGNIFFRDKLDLSFFVKDATGTVYLKNFNDLFDFKEEKARTTLLARNNVFKKREEQKQRARAMRRLKKVSKSCNRKLFSAFD